MSRKLRKKILGDSLIWVIIAAFVVIMLFPFVYILSTALKSDTDLATSVGRILPKAAQWENFTKAWQLLDFPKCFFNSFIVAIAVTALTIFLCSLAAYVFTRLEFKGRNIVFILYLSTMMIPITVRLIPSYNLCRNLNMLDTYMGMILPQADMVHSVWKHFLCASFIWEYRSNWMKQQKLMEQIISRYSGRSYCQIRNQV